MRPTAGVNCWLACAWPAQLLGHMAIATGLQRPGSLKQHAAAPEVCGAGPHAGHSLHLTSHITMSVCSVCGGVSVGESWKEPVDVCIVVFSESAPKSYYLRESISEGIAVSAGKNF